jgi:hypothetical protein
MRDLFRRTGPIVVALTLSGMLLAGCEPPPSGPKFFGMHSDATFDVDNSRISSAFDAEKAFGSRITRNTLRWKFAQPSRTTYDWSKTDYVVNQAAARGMQVLLTVREAPKWANGSSDTRIIPSDPAGFDQFVLDYKNFVKTAVQRYGDRVKYWEVWTEPNQIYFWQPRGLDPKRDQARWIDMYGQLYTKTRAAVRKINTSVEIAVGSIAGLGASCCIVGPVFLDGLITRGVVFNDVAIEPHSIRNQAPWKTIQNEGNFSDIKIMRDVLVYRGLSNVNLWVTEWGWKVAGYTSPGSTTTQLKVPGNFYALALWPDTGQVVVAGVVRDYSSINRNASYDSNGDGVPEAHNFINLTTALPSAPAAGIEVASATAEAKQAKFVQEAIKMLRGTYVPKSGRPQQNYNYVEIATYFQNYDLQRSSWGMYGLMHEPVPDYSHPGTWFLKGRPAAAAFLDGTT